MKRTQAFLIFFLLIFFSQYGFSQNKEKDQQVLKTMKKATCFMMDKVSYNGGFVWNYLPDFSRSWGEMEAKRTMVWIQPPGTPSMGHILLDTYHATGDEYYYESAKKVAEILIKGQLPCGGWNYMFDLAGEDSLKQWYETIGKNAWRLEEFQHYYGNATFDDAGTMEASKFLLRMYMEKKDTTFLPALEKTISLVLESQYPVGGWPQRYPLKHDFSKNGKEDYSSFITINDEVMMENIEFLLLCYQTLDRKDLKEPILRAMYCFKKLQQGQPYPGWSDQYTTDLKPAHARSYEPRSINTGTTVGAIGTMIRFFKLTGDTAFLSGIPAAIDFIESQKLPESEIERSGKSLRGENTIMVPRFIDPDTGKPLYVHRKGTNANNGHYYTDQDIRNTIGHYSSQSMIDISELRNTYDEIMRAPVNEMTKDSPLLNEQHKDLPVYFTRTRMRRDPLDTDDITDMTDRIVSTLNEEGYWPSPFYSISNPYIGEGTAEGSEETKYIGTMVGDKYDTSCYSAPRGTTCISTSMYIMNMSQLNKYLENQKLK